MTLGMTVEDQVCVLEYDVAIQVQAPDTQRVMPALVIGGCSIRRSLNKNAEALLQLCIHVLLQNIKSAKETRQEKHEMDIPPPKSDPALHVADRILWLDTMRDVVPLGAPKMAPQKSSSRPKKTNDDSGQTPQCATRTHITREAFAAMLEGRSYPSQPVSASSVPVGESVDVEHTHVSQKHASQKTIAPKISISKIPTHPVSFDPRVRQKIIRGAQRLEAVVDLHGLTQNEAYDVLSHFIARCVQRGLRNVLVITGKGTNKGYTHHNTNGITNNMGILRRKVPQWLAMPSLNPFILMVDLAAPVHGGEGALYIRLRKPTHEDA
jgi:DNA-nicking Smr family endonuclease